MSILEGRYFLSIGRLQLSLRIVGHIGQSVRAEAETGMGHLTSGTTVLQINHVAM